ncbi:MAG: transcriptional regulator GcvA [Myxococcales bacterium]|nr:transcriptional regulator GcvA [Myxococcales bacterium]MCB9652176.1 transcriptional regulator GcvA [Deltaproteobacteria bacterium]
MSAPRLPSLSALRAFEAAARHLSFTRAAEELFVTQAAISHQVRALEEEVGCPLFVRLPRRVALSEEGRVLAEAATEAFGRISAGMEALSRAGATGVVSVSVSPSMAVRWLVPRLESFRDQHPDIDVRISANDRLIDPVREGVDLCIRYGTGRYPGLETTLLMKDEVFPVCSPAFLLKDPPLKAPADLKDHVLLHDDMMKHDAARPDWPKWLEAAGVEGLDPRDGLHFSHASMALDAALAGQGVALGRSTLVNDDVVAGRLVKPFDVTFLSGFSYFIAVPKGAVLGSRVQTFREWLLQQAREFTAGVPGTGPDAK